MSPGYTSDGVEYSTFEDEYRVLALRIFEYEYWWLASSTSIRPTSSSTSTEYILIFRSYTLHFKVNNKTRRCVFPFYFANISKSTCDRNLIFTFNEEQRLNIKCMQ